jgi:UrcA family protein
MKKKPVSHHRFMLAALIPAVIGLAAMPALAQQTGEKWKPRTESITVSSAPVKNWREILTGSHLGSAFMVSASVPVPYSDLDLANEPGATELGRRIHVAARLVCQELDLKYPPAIYPILDGYSGFDCVNAAANQSMTQANTIIASARH